MYITFPTCVDEVSRCDAIEVVDIRLETAQEGGGFFKGKARNLQSRLAYFEDVFIV